MSDVDISPKRLAKLLDGLTPGPWAASAAGNEELSLYGPGDNVMVIGGCGCCGSPFGDNLERDAEFIAAARTLVPALAARVAELEGERDKLAGINAELVRAKNFMNIEGARTDEALDATREERNALAVAIMGGEDVPGIAACVTVDELVAMLAKERRHRDDWTDACVRIAVDNERARAASRFGEPSSEPHESPKPL